MYPNCSKAPTRTLLLQVAHGMCQKGYIQTLHVLPYPIKGHLLPKICDYGSKYVSVFVIFYPRLWNWKNTNRNFLATAEQNGGAITILWRFLWWRVILIWIGLKKKKGKEWMKWDEADTSDLAFSALSHRDKESERRKRNKKQVLTHHVGQIKTTILNDPKAH